MVFRTRQKSGKKQDNKMKEVRTMKQPLTRRQHQHPATRYQKKGPAKPVDPVSSGPADMGALSEQGETRLFRRRALLGN